jgi:hypothetical protein
VLLFEIVFWLNFWIALLENIEKAGNNPLYFSPGEFGAYPDHEAGYFGHMGLPPGGLQTPFNPISMGGGKPFSNKALRVKGIEHY